MTVGRRGFLGLFAASPLAAKAAADKTIADLTGMGSQGGFGLSGASVGEPAHSATAERASKVSSFLRRFGGLPEWEVERVKRDNRLVYALDPDLAALKSFSMNVKIATQRERNIERMVKHVEGYSDYDTLREKFQREHGFWFWW